VLYPVIKYHRPSQEASWARPCVPAQGPAAVLRLGHTDPGPRGRAGCHQRGLPGHIEELNRDILHAALDETFCCACLRLGNK
jgi:hypothetical protein